MTHPHDPTPDEIAAAKKAAADLARNQEFYSGGSRGGGDGGVPERDWNIRGRGKRMCVDACWGKYLSRKKDINRTHDLQVLYCITTAESMDELGACIDASLDVAIEQTRLNIKALKECLAVCEKKRFIEIPGQ